MVHGNLRYRGFTMIDSLVASGVITLICAVTFPVVQYSRETARRNQCQERLKQIGIALHQYHETYVSTFPPGFIVGGNDVYHGWSWSVFVLPYLTDNSCYNSIQFESGLQSEYSKPELQSPLSMYRCPADTGPDVVASVSIVNKPVVDWTVTSGRAIGTFAKSNYFGNAGFLQDYAGGIRFDDSATPTNLDANVNDGSLGTAATKFLLYHRYVDQQNFRGVFGQNSRIGIRDMTDGTAATMMVGERYSPRASLIGPSAIGNGGWLGVPDPTTSAGLAMSLGDTSTDIKSNTNGRFTTGFGSLHYGGANLLLGDGRVHFVSDKLDTRMYRQLSVIDDGMVHSCGF